MPYANIVFVKLEKRLLNDPRWWTMSEAAQLIYIKLILLAAETYNKIPLNDDVLKEAIRSKLPLKVFQKHLEEVKTNFPKFQKNMHVRYFLEFDTKTNYRPQKGTPKELQRNSQGTPKVVTEKEQEEEKEKKKNKSGKAKKSFDFSLTTSFEEIWKSYPKPIGRKEAFRHFRSSVVSDKDKEDIKAALENYKKSDTVAKGFIQNGSTWFNNWKDWVAMPHPADGIPESLRQYVKTNKPV